MPITSQAIAYPVELSAPFAGRGDWTFLFTGGPLDGATALAELELVLRRLDITKWRFNKTSTALYYIHAIDRENKQLYVAHTHSPWMGS